MQTIKRPEWLQITLKNLEIIEKHADDYEDLEDGTKAPSKEVFDSVRAFLAALDSNCKEAKLEEPKLFVSPNGHLVLSYGGPKKSLDIRFTPAIQYLFKSQSESFIGDQITDILELVCRQFAIA